MQNRTYIAIDLKSVYASVECMVRRLDPLTTNFVVADENHTENETPSLKSYGISGQTRLFEVVQKIKEVNVARLRNLCGHQFSGSYFDDTQLKTDHTLEMDYVIAKEKMKEE